MTEPGFDCGVCGLRHLGPPRAYESAAPQAWHAVPEDQREERTRLDGELATVTDEREVIHWFVRGTIELPVTGEDQSFLATVWLELGPQDLRELLERWVDADRAEDPARLGTVANDVLGFPPAVGIPGLLHPSAPGIRPRIELVDDDHELSRAQRDGVDPGLVRRIAELVAHPAEG